MYRMRFAYLTALALAFAVPARAQSNVASVTAAARAAIEAQDYDRAATLTEEGLSAAPDDASLLNLRGTVGYLRGDFQSAETDFSRAAELAPDSAQFRVNLSYAVIQQAKVEQAFEVINDAVERYPMEGVVWTTRGYFNSVEGDLNAAITDYSKAIEVEPDAPDAYFRRAQAFEARGLYERAVQDYTSYIDRAPSYDVAYSNRGLSRARTGDLEGAIPDFDKAVELNPSNAVTLVNRASVKDMLGRVEDAVADYEIALEVDAKNEMAYNELFAISWRKGEMTKALAVAERAIENLPDNAIGYNMKASAFLARKASVDELDEAATAADKAVKLAPDEAQGYANRCAAFIYLAVAQNILGAMENFIDDCEQALEIDPDYFDAYEHIGVAYAALGDQEKANDADRKADEIRRRLADQ